MHALLPALALVGFFASTLHAQVVPTTPSKFDTRRLGDTVNGGGTVGFTAKPPQVTVRSVTHIVLGEPRQWMMNDGKFFVGKLIAFEDLVTERSAATPAVPKNPTVVRDGKARLLVNAKPYEIALERLRTDERSFIEEVRATLAAKK